jgi:radical SAM protein with 4Fe4S-binding SPASM domain
MAERTFLRRSWENLQWLRRRKDYWFRISPLIVKLWTVIHDLRQGYDIEPPAHRIASLTALRKLGERFTRTQAVEAVMPPPEISKQKYFDDLLWDGLVIDAVGDPFQEIFVRYASIQNCTHCNARCSYCPLTKNPKPKRFMSMELFRRAVEQVASVEPRWVMLNQANEPLLHPEFLEQAKCLADHGLKLKLFTNGTLLRPEISRALADLNVVSNAVINVPSLDADEYRYFMGIGMSPHLRENLAAAVETKMPLVLVVNGLTRLRERAVELENAFAGPERPHVTVAENNTHSIAGRIESGENTVEQHWPGKLGGCRYHLEQAEINVEGKVLMCCEDYYDQHVMGDIATQSLREILLGEKAREYHRQIFGMARTGQNHLCRRCFVLLRRGENDLFACGNG